MKKEEIRKIGRPKLADNKMKKNATIYVLIAILLLVVLIVGGTYSLYVSFSTNKLKGYAFCGPYSKPVCSSQKLNGYPCRWINGGCYAGMPNTTKKTTTTTKKTTKKTTTKINKKKYFTVKFRNNGGTGSMSDQYVMHGDYNNNKSTKLKKNQFKKNDHNFIGWYAQRSADGKWYGYNSKNKLSWYPKKEIRKYYLYKDEQGVSRTVAPKAYVTMHAQWTKKAPSPRKIVLNCPTSVKVNQHFKCTTNMSGVKITATNKYLTKYSSTFTTTNSDKAKDLQYKNPSTVTVTATKSTYNKVTKYVAVNGKNYKKYSDGFIYYNQDDYIDYKYNSGVSGDNISLSGCGTTSMAMVLATLLKDESITPPVTTNEACSNNYCHDYGTDSDYFAYASGKRKIKAELYQDSSVLQMNSTNLAKVATTLHNGGLAIVGVNEKSPFTTGGHFIVIRKLVEYNAQNPIKSTVYVGDPKHPDKNETPYKLTDFLYSSGGRWLTGIYLFSKK